jgi:hypothetical protein
VIESLELRDPHEHGCVPVEVRRRKEDVAGVGEEQLLHVEIGHPKHQDVV